jgi:hypothetical protein
MVCPKVPARVVHQLTIAGVVDGFDCHNARGEIRAVMLNVLDELRFGAGRAGDEDDAGVSHRVRHALEEVVILARVPAADAVGLVVQVPGGIIGMYDEAVDLCCVEMKHARFAMIDPHHGVVVS